MDDPNIPSGHLRVYGTFKCASCKALAIGITSILTADFQVNGERTLDTFGVMRWTPSPGETTTYPDVPTHIAESAIEAYECHSAEHYRASILLSRSVIEATAKDKGIDQGNLKAKIEELFNKRLVREHIKDGAHSIRDLGNEMAHGDFAQPVTEADSQLVIALMEEILAEVYQSPAKVAKAQAAVAARKGTS